MSVFGQAAREVGKFFDLRVREYEERMSSPYCRLMREVTWQHVRRFLPRRSGARILDAGGATGYWSIRLAEAGYRVVLLDVSEGMLAAARDKVQAAGQADKVDIVHGDLTDLREFAEGSFDAVLAVEEPLSFSSDPGMAIAEIALVTRPGGLVAASVANRFRAREFERFLRKGDVEALARYLAGGAPAVCPSPGAGAVCRRAFAAEEVESLFAASSLEVASAIGKPVFAGAVGARLGDKEVFARVLDMETAHNANRSLWGNADVLEFVATRA